VGLFQIAFSVWCAGGPTWSDGWKSLHRWDSGWYASIAVKGYVTPYRPLREQPHLSNVGFFPGYPMTAAALMKATGLDVRSSLIIAAQAAAVAFWLLLLRWMRHKGFSRRRKLAFLALVLAYPASCFLTFAYSEALFCAGLIGFHGACRSPLGRAAAGALMCGTRLVGVPAVVARAGRYAFAWARRLAPARAAITEGLVCLAALAGTGAFFAYCWLKFGHWDIYFLSQRIGWNQVPDYIGPLHPATYSFDPRKALADLFTLDPEKFDSRLFSRVMASVVPVSGAICAGVGTFLGGSKMLSLDVLEALASAFLIYYVSIASQVCKNLESMARYGLPVFILFLMALFEASLGSPRRFPSWFRIPAYAMLFALMIWSFLVERVFIREFALGRWAS
jgi:hypothetical protein